MTKQGAYAHGYLTAALRRGATKFAQDAAARAMASMQGLSNHPNPQVQATARDGLERVRAAQANPGARFGSLFLRGGPKPAGPALGDDSLMKAVQHAQDLKTGKVKPNWMERGVNALTTGVAGAYNGQLPPTARSTAFMQPKQ